MEGHRSIGTARIGFMTTDIVATRGVASGLQRYGYTGQSDNVASIVSVVRSLPDLGREPIQIRKAR